MRPALLFLVLCTLPVRLVAAPPVDYLRDVKPLLQERCYACHGPLKQRGKLRLDTAVAIRNGGAGGPAITIADPAKSPLLTRVAAADATERMPPEGDPLTTAQVAVLTAWVRQGAPAPSDEKPAADPREHWAFRPPVRPELPDVKHRSWVRNPIDRFVAVRHERAGMTPLPEADAATLLRRVTLDLTGLPPTRAELHAFLADHRPGAYERTVERLLASPRYAERWARHWMDIWRYSDWYGSRNLNELRYSRRHIWRWRDWIIESLESDKGYNRMVVEMLAADEAAPGDADAERASGFLGRNYYVFNRHVWLHDTVEYVGTGLLGLTMKCCRCHDHKYDPLSQLDYFRLRAFFEPHRVRTDPLPGPREKLKANIAMGSPPGSDLKAGRDCVYDAEPAAVTYLLERGDEKLPAKDRPLKPGLPGLLCRDELDIEPVRLPLEAFYPELRDEIVDPLLEEARSKVVNAENETARSPGKLADARLAAARAALDALEARVSAERVRFERHPADVKARGHATVAGRAERTAALRQAEVDVLVAEGQGVAKALADARTRLETAQKAALDPAPTCTPLGPTYPPTSSGRRLALARWITSRDNPLAARVAVNHLWLRHLGVGLVPSPHNFGLNGKPPSHPELLDWLAVEFMESGWSMKHLHRLIVTSATYRLASAGATSPVADPENRLLWRANVRRMEAEVVRDGLLHLAGRLDVRRGGEDLDPTQDALVFRRSLYFRHTPDEKPLLLDVFDAANPSECFERTESVIPQQALALANGDFSHSQARLIARRLASEVDFVGAAFEHLFGRPPHSEERRRCEAFLGEHAGLFGPGRKLQPASSSGDVSKVPPSADPALRARENLVHVLVNYNEFVTLR